MPEMSGFDAILAIRDEFPGARIIVLTTYDGDVQAQRAIKAGAQGYLLKNLLHTPPEQSRPNHGVGCSA
jgi:DNA-binding NarL/FixJ family response regulator